MKARNLLLTAAAAGDTAATIRSWRRAEATVNEEEYEPDAIPLLSPTAPCVALPARAVTPVLAEPFLCPPHPATTHEFAGPGVILWVIGEVADSAVAVADTRLAVV